MDFLAAIAYLDSTLRKALQYIRRRWLKVDANVSSILGEDRDKDLSML